MKKSKLSKSLVTGFIASMALAACSSAVSSNDKAILTYTGFDGKKYDIVTEKVYAEYKSDKSVVSKFYDRVLEVLIRDAYKNNSTLKIFTDVRSYEQIEKEAEQQVEDKKTEASASGNYDSQWESILNSNNVEDAEGLKEKFIYELEKEELTEWYYRENRELLTKEYLGTAGSTNVVARNPYHVRHTLVKVDSGYSDFTRNTISQSQAELLSNTVTDLAKGTYNTFGGIAQKYSEDSGSKDTFGDVGLMTTEISSGKFGMTTEFQLGTYLFDALMSGRNLDANDSHLKAIGAGDAGLDSLNLRAVPYSVFEDLLKYSETTTDADGKILGEEDQSAIYPRNILWNKYLNIRSPFVITDNSRLAGTSTVKGMGEDINKVGADHVAVPAKTAGKTGFKKVADLGITLKGIDNETKVLVDENDNVIYGVRSTFGIHLMIVERSIFDETLNGTTLEQYYTTYTPSETNAPKDGTGYPLKTFINYVDTKDKSVYTSRADTMKSQIKGFDAGYEYRLYSTLINNASLKARFNGLDENAFITSISEYITRTRQKYIDDQQEGVEDIWEDYVDLLEIQDSSRLNTNIMVPEGCIIGFNEAGHDALYAKGGACYYGNKK